MKKTIHTVLSVLLCCVLLTAFVPLVYAEDTLIEEAFATYSVPAEGEPMDFSAITVPLGAHYTAEIKSVYYYADGKSAHIADGDIVQAGMHYRVRIRFYAEQGYRLEDGVTVYTINGETMTGVVGSNMPEVTFVPSKPVLPADPTPSEPTFRDRVATFFRDMRNRFVFLILWLRSLFKIK